MPSARHNKYVPGMYSKKRISTSAMVDRFVKEWEMKKELKKEVSSKHSIETSHYICFSRKIGVGALEIADILSKKIGWKVVDREIMEHIVEHNSLKTNTLDGFDERYPGMVTEFISFLFGEKSITMADYMRHLVKAVITIAETGPTIFVGRATHMILPRRDNVLAVRFISSKDYRARRLADMLGVSIKDAGMVVDEEDKQQREFFKKNFAKKDASPYEFDIVINCDHISKAQDAAELVLQAYEMKFEKKPDKENS
jgi:cytidylate kinase